MKMRNILRDRKSRQCFSGCSINMVGSDGPDDLGARDIAGGSTVNDRAAADAVNCHSVDKVCGAKILPSADVPSKKSTK